VRPSAPRVVEQRARIVSNRTVKVGSFQVGISKPRSSGSGRTGTLPFRLQAR